MSSNGAFIRIAVGVVLLAHGLVHLLYLIKEPDDPKFPFTLDSSWLVPESSRRSVGVALIVATIVGFALLALAVWGVPGMAGVWPVIAVVASVVSLVLLVAYWNTQLVFGVAINVALVALAVIRPEWIEEHIG